MKNGEIVIDPEFSTVFDPSEPKQLNILRDLMLAHGCHPLIVWEETNILLDGHNRLMLCQELKIPFTVVKKSFPSREAALEWIIDNQISRRNLSPVAKERFLKNRRERVHVARAAGDSIRTIAENVGVSKSQVERDLSKSGVPLGTPDAPNIEDSQKTAKVAGRDGKMYPARMNRTSGESNGREPGDDTEAETAEAERNRKARRENGKPTWSVKATTDAIGKAIRCCHEEAKARGQMKNPIYRKVDEMFGSILNKMAELRKCK